MHELQTFELNFSSHQDELRFNTLNIIFKVKPLSKVGSFYENVIETEYKIFLYHESQEFQNKSFHINPKNQ